MDGSSFDQLARLTVVDASRRTLFRSAFASALGLLGLGTVSLLDIGEAEAKKKKKKNKKNRGKKRRRRRCKPKPSGSPCQTDKDCCTKKTKRICDVPHGAGNSDKKCCGGQGAPCGGVNEDGDALPPFCCVGEAGVRQFVCSENDETNPNVPGTCQPAPDEP